MLPVAPMPPTTVNAPVVVFVLAVPLVICKSVPVPVLTAEFDTVAPT